jgi:hypothetical protein
VTPPASLRNIRLGVEVTDSDKRTNLLHQGFIYCRKKFIVLTKDWLYLIGLRLVFTLN